MQIRAKKVRKEYGTVTALDGLSLEVPAGSTFGVLGTNGAGKTTLFKLLVGLDRPDSGRLLLDGQQVTAAGRDLRACVGYLPERIGFPPALTGREVLQFHAGIRDLESPDRIAAALDVVGLSEDAADRPVSGYSNGMRRRLGLAAAVLPNPSVLVLDEPTAGLDPRGVIEFHRLIDRVRIETDATVVLSSHVLSEVERLCDHVAIVNQGRVVATGTIDDLVDTTDVTISLRPADASHREHVLAVGTAHGRAAETNGTITVTCPPGAVPAFFADLDDAVELEDVQVERDGLEAAFHDTLGVAEP